MNDLSCLSCGSPLRAGAKFCPRCGRPAAAQPAGEPQAAGAGGFEPLQPTQAAPEPAAAGETCARCGQSNRPGARHCAFCGAPLRPTGSEASPPRPADPVYTPPPYEPPAYTPPVHRTSPPYGRAPASRKPYLWALAGLVVLLCLGGGGAAVWAISSAIDHAGEKVIDEVEEKVTQIIDQIPTGLPTIGALEIPTLGPINLPTLAPIGLPTSFPDWGNTPVTAPGIGIELPHLTDEEEIEIGRESAAEYESENRLSSDAALISRVETIGRRIVPYSDRSHLPFTFKVVVDEQVNAYAIPGGFIYVTTGMLEFVDNDEELAGVIGHEIAHVARRHGAQLIERLATAQAAMDALSTANPDFSDIYQDESSQLAMQVVSEILINGWGRQNELDADEYGAVYMSRSGYHTRAILDLFGRFQAAEEASGSPLDDLFATHPPFADRIARVKETIQKHGLQ